MTKSLCLAATLSALLCIGGTARAQAPAALQAPDTPGTYELTLGSGDTGHRYTLVIPATYTGRESVPLIFSLHYGGEVTPFFGRGLVAALIEPALRDLGAIVVAPDNISRGWANAQAQQQVVELFDFIAANYNIDADRTLLTGYSMGGKGTWYLARRLADRFAAAIPMAGAPEPDAAEGSWQTPTYAINSNADELIPLPPVRVAVEQLQRTGAPIKIVVLDKITHFQTDRYQPHLKAAVPWIQEVWAK